MPLEVGVCDRVGAFLGFLEREGVVLVDVVEREAFLTAFVAAFFFDAVFFFDADFLAFALAVFFVIDFLATFFFAMCGSFGQAA
jgi:hypothetical protein